MISVKQFLPQETSRDLSSLQQELLAQKPTLLPFAPEVKKFLGDFSARLLGDAAARQYPALQTLGFWLRPTSLTQIEADYRHLSNTQRVLVPRGTVLHFPPANIDTMFVYGLALALLAGNRSVIRLSNRVGKTGQLLTNLLRQELAEHPVLSGTIYIVSYDHDTAITAALSQIADARMIWGGDTAVAAIRAIPAASHCHDLCFTDKFSWMAIDASYYLECKVDRRNHIAAALANDIFWFEQQACSSPRAIVWVGDQLLATEIADDFYQRLVTAATEKNLLPDTSSRIAQLNADYLAQIDLPVTRRRNYGTRLTVLHCDSFDGLRDFKRMNYGHGLLLEHNASDLAALAAITEPRDQTLVYVGFSPAKLQDFANQTLGRGFNRLVPAGQALAFHHRWDGYDIIQQLTQQLQIGYEAS